jgi:hypothetical protein
MDPVGHAYLVAQVKAMEAVAKRNPQAELKLRLRLSCQCGTKWPCALHRKVGE